MRILLNLLKSYFNQKTKQTNAITENTLQITAFFYLNLASFKTEAIPSIRFFFHTDNKLNKFYLLTNII